MIAVRFLSRAQWERRLRARGAEPLAGKGPLNTAEWWRRGGFLFTVPLEDEDGRAEHWAIQKLCTKLEQLVTSETSPPDEDPDGEQP